MILHHYLQDGHIDYCYYNNTGSGLANRDRKSACRPACNRAGLARILNRRVEKLKGGI